jgi:hypothetical protein
MPGDDVVIEKELTDFVAGRFAPASFPHREHLRLAFEMLSPHSFGETVDRFSTGLKLLAARAGRPAAYHATRTMAFLALIAERRARGSGLFWKEFIAVNADLAEKRCLEIWYDVGELESEAARRVFVLPQRARRAVAAR